jgi:hypothetical protein
MRWRKWQTLYETYISKVSIQHLHIAVHNLECNQFIIRRADTTNEEQGRISSIYHLGVYGNVSDTLPPDAIRVPLYSRKLHILVRLPSTSCVTSLTILPFALGAMVVNHFASLTLPVKVASILHRHRLVKLKMTLT